MDISRDEVKKILSNAPEGTDHKVILDGLVNRGFNIEGVDNDSIRAKFAEAETIQTTADEADVRSAEDTGASFPSVQDEGILKAGAKTIGNIPSSAWNLTKGIASAVAHPIQTTKAVSNIVKGGAEKGTREVLERVGFEEEADATEQSEAEQTFMALAGSLKDRYGSVDALQRTLTNDPTGVAADVVGILTGGGGAPKMALQSAKALDKVSDVKNLAKTKVAPVVDKAAVSQMDKALALQPTDKIRIMKPNIANGTTPSEWLIARDFKGSRAKIADDLDLHGIDSQTQVRNIVDSIDTRFAPDEVPYVQDAIGNIRGLYEGTVGNERMIAHLDDLYTRKDYNTGDLQDIKQLMDAELNLFKATGDPKTSAQAVGLRNIRNQIKTKIEDVAEKNDLPDVQKLNKETQISREIRNSIEKVEARNPMELSLRDFTAAGGAAIAGGPAAAVVVVALKKIYENPATRTALANRLKNLTKADEVKLGDAIRNRDIPTIELIMTPIIAEIGGLEVENENTEE